MDKHVTLSLYPPGPQKTHGFFPKISSFEPVCLHQIQRYLDEHEADKIEVLGLDISEVMYF